MFPQQCIEGRGPVEWASKLHELETVAFAFWGILKVQFHALKIRDHNLRHRIAGCYFAARPNVLSKMHTNMKNRLRRRIVSA
jgi:hypothetical protein